MWKDLNNTFWCVSVTHGWVPNAEVRRAARWTGVSPPQSLTDIKAWELIRPLPNSRLVFGKWEICYSNVRTLYAIRLYDTDFIHSKSTLTPKFFTIVHFTPSKGGNPVEWIHTPLTFFPKWFRACFVAASFLRATARLTKLWINGAIFIYIFPPTLAATK